MLSEALANISNAYQYHWSLKGHLFKRLLYVTLGYLIYVIFRWGDRHDRVARWLNATGLPQKLIQIETPDGLRLFMDLNSCCDVLYSVDACFDYARMDEFLPKPGWIVLDVGAHQGLYTTWAAKKVGVSGKVIAFEPYPANFLLLQRNILNNHFTNRTLLSGYAVGLNPGKKKLYIHPRSINHSLIRQSDTFIDAHVTTIDEACRSMSYNVNRLDLIKIDTEGNTLDILAGGEGTLRKFHPKIVFEYEGIEDAMIDQYFRHNLRYSILRIGNIGYAQKENK